MFNGTEGVHHNIHSYIPARGRLINYMQTNNMEYTSQGRINGYRTAKNM
jgi:hypothetical protein